MSIKLTFLGVGSAFTKKNYQSNMLLEVSAYAGTKAGPGGVAEPVQITGRMLIDCGRTAPEALTEAGYNWWDVDALYVSHQHSDHIGGIEELALMRHFVPMDKAKPYLFVNERLAHDLWVHSLQGGLACLEGKVCTLDTYFDVKRVPINEGFFFCGVSFTPVQTIHIMNGYGIVPSYGLIWRCPASDKTVFLTTDSQHCPYQIMAFYKTADVIFQDCEITPYERRSNVHAHYDDLKTLPAEVKAKMWLYHYQDTDALPDAVEDGFLGFVTKGQVFEL